MKKSSTCTRCTGRSSSSASSEPIKNSPPGISASSGSKSVDIDVAQEDSACAFSTTLAGMQLETFALERYQSVWENRVTWNLAESGVHPLRVTDLVNTPELQ